MQEKLYCWSRAQEICAQQRKLRQRRCQVNRLPPVVHSTWSDLTLPPGSSSDRQGSQQWLRIKQTLPLCPSQWNTTRGPEQTSDCPSVQLYRRTSQNPEKEMLPKITKGTNRWVCKFPWGLLQRPRTAQVKSVYLKANSEAKDHSKSSITCWILSFMFLAIFENYYFSWVTQWLSKLTSITQKTTRF